MAKAWVVFGCALHRVGGHTDQNVSALSERSLLLVEAGFPAGDPMPGPGELTAGDTERWYSCLGGWASCWEPAKCPGSVAGTIPAQAWPCRAAGGHGELASPRLVVLEPGAGRHVLRQRDRPPDKGFIFMQLSPCPELCLRLWQKGSYPRSEHCLEPAQGIGFQFQQRLSFPFFSYPSSHHRIIPIPISLPPSPFLSLPL